MVSNEEIKRMLENRRRGIKTEPKKEAPAPVPPGTGRKPMSPPAPTCESCGAQNPPDSKFCIKCGAALSAPEKVEEKKKAESPQVNLPRSGMDGIDYKTCPNCSHQNKPLAKFCVVCGHKLEDVDVSKPETGSLLERVPDTSESELEEEKVVDQPAGEETPAVAELIDDESVQEETQKRSLLSRKVPEEELSADEIETTTEEAPEDIAREPAVEEPEIKATTGEEPEIEGTTEEETATEESTEEDPAVNLTAEAVPEDVPSVETTLKEATPEEEVPEEEELPQVKTFKFGQDSPEREEEPAAEIVTGEDAAQTTEPSPADPMEKIKKAKELLDIGAITEDEFEEIKKKYLAMI